MFHVIYTLRRPDSSKYIFQVDISVHNSEYGYKPKDKLELRVSTKGRDESLVAFSAVDTALYNLKSNDKDPLKKVK